MKTEVKFVLLLVFLSPVLGELLSGSAPPLEFFNPFGFLIIVTFYGGGALLVREAKAWWHLQWSVGFLAVAYGILEEGVMMQSFFNFNHADLGMLARYGEYFGVHWPWTLMLIVYHATISILLPIAIVELIWPEYKTTPFLKKKSLLFTGSVVTVTTVIMMIVVWQQQTEFPVPYVPDPLLLLGSVGIIFVLVWLSYHFRDSRVNTTILPLFPPVVFTVFGFFLHVGNLFIPNILAENRVNGLVTIFIQCIGILIVLLFVRYEILHQTVTPRHLSAFIVGSLMFFIVLTPIHEFINGATGMFVVGIISFIMVLWWRRHILRKNRIGGGISGKNSFDG